MKGVAIIIVGYQGAGKTLLSKALLKGAHHSRIKILDINDEYKKEFPSSPVMKVNAKGKLRPDKQMFREMMIDMDNTIFVCEDATVVFSHRSYDEELLEAIVAKRHSGNMYLFLYHSLRSIPRDVYDYFDELWLLKTADSDDAITKFRGTGVQELLNEVRLLPEFEYSERQKLPIRDKHFKVLQIKKGKLDKTVSRPAA
jgi:archaellum biogenesis ATPase FlaH